MKKLFDCTLIALQFFCSFKTRIYPTAVQNGKLQHGLQARLPLCKNMTIDNSAIYIYNIHIYIYIHDVCTSLREFVHTFTYVYMEHYANKNNFHNKYISRSVNFFSKVAWDALTIMKTERWVQKNIACVYIYLFEWYVTKPKISQSVLLLSRQLNYLFEASHTE